MKCHSCQTESAGHEIHHKRELKGSRAEEKHHKTQKHTLINVFDLFHTVFCHFARLDFLFMCDLFWKVLHELSSGGLKASFSPFCSCSYFSEFKMILICIDPELLLDIKG